MKDRPRLSGWTGEMLERCQQNIHRGCMFVRHINNYNKLVRFFSTIYEDMAQGLQEYNPPFWAKDLKNIPKLKVQLANPNTPIHQWNLPGVPSEFSLAIKRDDMTGSTLSGNKVRKLEFLMAEALFRNSKHVITCGGLQSNHCRAVATCARQLGLTPHLLLRTDITDPESVGCEGNLLLDRMCASSIYLAPRIAPYLTELKPRMEKIAQHIRDTTGESSYQIPVGGSNSVGVWGYISVFDELIKQGVQDRFDDIVFACGSGGTAAGLAIGNYLSGFKLRIHGISVSDDSKYFHGHVNEMLESAGIPVDVRSEDILHIIDGHKGKGYGISTQEELDFLVSVSCTTGIILDPVYTVKAVKGMLHVLQHSQDMFKGKRILYLHTGGVFGLYDERVNDTLKLPNANTNRVKVWKTLDSPPI